MPTLPAPLPAYDIPAGTPLEPSDPVHDYAVASEAVSRLLQQYQTPNTQALISALTGVFQDIEDALFQLLTQRSIFTAVGAQQDMIGRILGIGRQGLSDALYQLFLVSQSAVNKSSGGPEELYGAFANVLPAGSTMGIRYYPPASFLMTIVGALTSQEVLIIAQQLTTARAAGVGGALVYSPVAPSATLTFDTGPGFDVGQFAGVVTT
jgi:hypothetical protein